MQLGRPDLGAADVPAPSKLADTWGVHKECLDVSSEGVYTAVGTLLTELADVFPDEYCDLQ